MCPLNYIQALHRPRTVKEALRLMRRSKGSSRFLAGGSDLIAAGSNSTRSLIDIADLDLKYIREGKRYHRIGAATTIAELAESRLCQVFAGGVLAKAAQSWGSIQIANTATVGGNLVRECPTADLTTPLLALRAIIRSHTASGQRVASLEELWCPARRRGAGRGLIVEVLVPLPSGGRPLLGSFEKLTMASSYMAVAAVGIVLELDDTGHCRQAGVAVGCAGQKPVRLRAVEKLVLGRLLSNETIARASAQVAEDSPLLTDHRASSDYRREAARHLAEKALNEIASQGGERGH